MKLQDFPADFIYKKSSDEITKKMKIFTRAVAAIILLSVSLAAQIKENEAKPVVNIAGKWTGSFELIFPNGKSERETAWFDFVQNGNDVSGTAGPDAEKQTPIANGKISGKRLSFEMSVRAGTILIFDLILDENHLRGEATGDSADAKIKINVVRTSGSAVPESTASKSLYDEILQNDRQMFEAFNQRDLKKFKTFFSKDLEFYQDLTGLTDYAQNVRTFKTNFAKAARIRRELDLKSLEIYALKNYGAVEIGTHSFYTTEPEQAEKLTAEVKFIHVWQKKKGIWKVTRIISYGH